MATKLECFILHRSEVVLTLALLYSRALSTEKHIFHKFLTRQIAHRSHHSALVILILFTPIKKKGLQNTGLAEMNFLGSVPCLRLPRKEALRQKSRVWLFGKRWAVWWLSLPSISPAQGAARQQRYPLAPPPQSGENPLAWLYLSSSSPHAAEMMLSFTLPAGLENPCPVLRCALQPLYEFCSGEDV